MIIIIPDQVEAVATQQYYLECSSKDTYTSEYYPNNKYGNEINLIVDPRHGALLSQKQINHFFIYFPLGSIPSNAYIYSASLKIYCWSSTGSDRTHDCCRLTGSFSESTGSGGTCWNNEPGYTTSYKASVTSGGGWKTWNVKTMVEKFVDLTYTNYGWIIKDSVDPNAELSHVFKYYSKEQTGTSSDPKLEVYYCVPPVAQTNAATSVTSTSATLNGEVTDDGGDECSYAFRHRLYGEAYGEGKIVYTGSLETNDPFSKSISSLDEGRRYYFQPILNNDAGLSDWGTELSFLTAPGAMTGFTATPFGIGQINLTWSNGANGAGAYIEYRTTEPGGLELPWTPGDHIKIDADGYAAGTSFTHDGLDKNSSYWYKAWPYAYDGTWTSDGTDIKPYGTATSVINDQTEDFPGQWFLVDSDNLHSCCEGESPDLEAALDGDGTWGCSGHEEHWFILDLGTNYTVGKVRGRSNYNGYDPASVDIYVARTIEAIEGSNEEEFKLTKEGSITDWQKTQTWVTHDPEEDLDGRYVKVLITGQDELKFGQTDMLPLTPFSIFDVFVSNCLPEMKYSVNNSTPDMGSPITFDASESFDQGGSIDSYKWDFDGDGSTDETTEGAVTAHDYDFASVYYPTVTGIDNCSSENESKTLTITVKQKISLVKNSENDGINYVTWGATASIQADELAGESYADLQNNDVIQMFDATSGNWSIIYIYPGGPDFTINRWDHIRIHCTNAKTFSVTPDGSVSSSQNETLTYSVDNHGYHYYTWSNDFSIKASVFATNSKLDLTNQPISVYNPTTGKWKGYTEIPGLPQVIKDGMDFYINLYDVICFKVASGTENAYYDASNY